LIREEDKNRFANRVKRTARAQRTPLDPLFVRFLYSRALKRKEKIGDFDPPKRGSFKEEYYLKRTFYENAPALASSNASPSLNAELPEILLFEPEAMANAQPEASNVAPTSLLKLEPFVPFDDFESKGASSFPCIELVLFTVP
tara:strand:+ start:40 stop:468 length:429 start_codon:yes stop_codon:yes gene_type:complete